MGAQGIVQVGDHFKVFGAVEIIQIQPPFDIGNAILGEGRHPFLLINDIVIFGLEILNQVGEIDIVVGAFARLAGDNQRRAGLVDQDVVHFVDDGIVEFALANAC
jgi:hypothetical protein